MRAIVSALAVVLVAVVVVVGVVDKNKTGALINVLENSDTYVYSSVVQR